MPVLAPPTFGRAREGIGPLRLFRRWDRGGLLGHDDEDRRKDDGERRWAEVRHWPTRKNEADDRRSDEEHAAERKCDAKPPSGKTELTSQPAGSERKDRRREAREQNQPKKKTAHLGSDPAAAPEEVQLDCDRAQHCRNADPEGDVRRLEDGHQVGEVHAVEAG
jgi:hypothetical protein